MSLMVSIRGGVSVSPEGHRAVLRTVALLAIVLPIAIIGWICLDGPRVPHNDYWIYLNNIADDNGLKTGIADWTARHNDHLLTGAYAVYAANLVVTGGSNLGLTVFSWLCAIGVLAVLARWTIRSCGASTGAVPWLVAGSSWALFSPFLAMFWVLGFSGVHTLGSVLLSLVAIDLWQRHLDTGSPRWVIMCGVAVAVSLVFFSSSLALLPVLAVGALLQLGTRRRIVVPFLAGLALLGALWWSGVSPRPPDPQPGADLLALILFPFAMLGSPFTRMVELAAGIGLVGCVATCVVMLRNHHAVFADIRSGMTPWWMVGGFAAGNAVMTALARGDHGPSVAFATRYSVFPVLFWIALAILLASSVSGPRGRWLGLTVLAGLAVGTQLSGADYLRALRHRGFVEAAARASLDSGAIDRQAVRASITPWPHSFRRMLPVTKANGWVPFEGRDQLPIPRLVTPPAGVPALAVEGWVELKSGRYRVVGRAPAGFAPARPLWLVDSSHSVVGRAAIVPHSGRDAAHPAAIWIGYARLPAPRELALIDASGRAVGRIEAGDPADATKLAVAPFRSPFPRWHTAGRYLLPAFGRLLEPAD